MTNALPQKIAHYQAYDDEEKLVGVTGEITLPNLENMTETVSMTGVLGEFESPNIGHFGSISIEIPFQTLYDKSFSLQKNKNRAIVLRAARQSFENSGGILTHRGLKITMKGLPKGLNLGKMAIGASMESSNTLEITYLKIEEGKRVLLELDKLNFVFVLDDEDQLEEIRNLI